MSTPSIQTLITQAQQVLNLKSSNEIRATLAAVLANANVGTPLNPNLTTQQLWDEFYEIVRQPSDDIMSIITDQMMRMVFSPPAPGGAGADKQVIFNDGGVLAGDTKFLWDKNANRLDVDGPVVITGDLTVDTNVLKVDTTNNRVGIGTATPGCRVDIVSDSNTSLAPVLRVNSNNVAVSTALAYDGLIASGGMTLQSGASPFIINTNGANERYRIASDGVATWSNVGGVAGTAMTLNSTGLGVGTTNYIGKIQAAGLVAAADPTFGTSGTFIGAILNNDNTAPGLDLRRWTGAAANHGTTYISTDATGATFFYNGTQVSNTKATSLKMTLDASGNLLVGTPSALNGTSTFVSASNSLSINSTGAAGIGNALIVQRSVGDGNVLLFINQGVSVGTIVVTATATAYNTSSDYRLKQSVKPLAGGLARVNSLKPSTYKWNLDGSAGEGFIAHELAEFVPFAVSGQKDAVNEDGSIKIQGVDLSKIVPILVAAIQELTAEVNALKNA
jgi:hypothetical protein